MNIRRYACCALFLGLGACSSGGDDGPTGGATPPPTTTAPATTSSSLVLTVEGPPTKPGIEARVKTEVDNRSDGITGTTLTVSGARATLQAPTGWTTTKGDVTVVTSADSKARIAATSFTPGATDAKINAAATALGLTACEWNPPDTMNVGKNTLSSNGADGLCSRGPAKVKAAYVAPVNETLLVVGTWDDGGDSASVFGSMRSIVKVAGGAANDGVGPCCAALRQNANSAPPDQKGPMLQAAMICDGLRNHPQGKAALSSIRGMLKAASMPSACK